MKILLSIVCTIFLVGCATNKDVAMNKDSQWSASEAEQKRLETIAKIAEQGEGGVIAAAMLMQQNNTYRPTITKTTGDKVLDVVSALSPSIIGLGQIYATVDGNKMNKEIAVVQSNNSKDVRINSSDNAATVDMHTSDVMADIAAATIVTQTNTTATVLCVTDATYDCE